MSLVTNGTSIYFSFKNVPSVSTECMSNVNVMMSEDEAFLLVTNGRVTLRCNEMSFASVWQYKANIDIYGEAELNRQLTFGKIQHPTVDNSKTNLSIMGFL